MRTKTVCATSELDIFTLPPVQTSVVSSRWIDYTPTHAYSGGKTPIEIEIPGSIGEYIDLSNIYVYMRLSINNASNAKIGVTGVIGPINYIHSTMFKQVDVKFNNTLVSSNCEYAYRAEIESHLNYGTDAKLTQLKSALWQDDLSSSMDSILLTDSNSTTDKANAGLIKRRSAFLGKSVEVYGRPHLDVCNINKFLIDGVTVSLKFTKHADDFCLMGKGIFKLNIDEFVVVARKVKISNEVRMAHAMALERANAVYSVNRVSVQNRTINAGAASEKLENLVKGPLPKRIVIGMVTSEAFIGHLTLNPFNYDNFGLTELSVSVDGANEPYQPFSLDYTSATEPRYLRAYYTLIGLNDQNSHNITLKDYKDSYNLFVFDMSQDGCVDTDHLNEEKTGNLRITFKFAKALEKAVSVILYFEFESHFEITKLRNVEYDNVI